MSVIILPTWIFFVYYLFSGHKWTADVRAVNTVLLFDAPSHRCRSPVNFRGARHFCPKNMYEKVTKCPNFTWFLPEKLAKYPNFFIIFSRKINKIPEFYMTFARQIPEFYIIIARKIFFPNFRRARAPCPRFPRLCPLFRAPQWITAKNL